MLFSPANLPYWIFLITGVILFLWMIFTGGESELDADIDLDVETDSNFSFGKFLGWLGIGKIPLILLLAIDLSLWGVIGWMLNVWLTHITENRFSGTENMQYWIIILFISILLFSLVISVFIGKLIAEPMQKIFADFSEDVSTERLFGCIGTVTSVYIPMENLGKIGQVDILDPKGNFLTINAMIPDWATIAPQRGEKVIVIEIKQQIYLVIAQGSVDEDNWLNSSNRNNQI